MEGPAPLEDGMGEVDELEAFIAIFNSSDLFSTANYHYENPAIQYKSDV